MVAPAPIDLRNMTHWSHSVIFNIMPGMKYSEGLMNIIFGRAVPSAKAPFTFPHTFAELNLTENQYPGVDNQLNSTYTEKHHFGYRWWDQTKKTPLFPFGHGLSYSKFEYLAMNVSKEEVSVTIKNIGKWTASEVVQFYL